MPELVAGFTARNANESRRSPRAARWRKISALEFVVEPVLLRIE
jgi:hypothetical protein